MKWKMLFSACSLFVSFLGAALAANEDHLVSKDLNQNIGNGHIKAVSIPFQMVRNNICIRAKLNNCAEGVFLVDTGRTNSAVDITVSNSLGTKSHGKAGKAEDRRKVIKLQSLRIGGLQLHHVPFDVCNLSALRHNKADGPVGIIGESVLKQFTITLDYKNRIIIFQNPDIVIDSQGATVLKARAACDGSGLLFDSLLDETLKLPCLFDTGAQVNLVPMSLVKTVLKSPPTASEETRGLSGEKVKTADVRFRSWQAGNFICKNPVFFVTMPEAPEKSDPEGISTLRFAFLGNEIWDNSAVTLDYRHKRILVRKSN